MCISSAAISSIDRTPLRARAWERRAQCCFASVIVALLASAFVVVMPWWCALGIYLVCVSVVIVVVRGWYRRIIVCVVAFFGFVHGPNADRSDTPVSTFVSPSGERAVELVRTDVGDAVLMRGDLSARHLRAAFVGAERARLRVSRGIANVAWSDDETRVVLLGRAQRWGEIVACTDAQDIVGVVDVDTMKLVSLSRPPWPPETIVATLRDMGWNAPLVFRAPTVSRPLSWSCRAGG